jgi:hypothetical protein
MPLPVYRRNSRARLLAAQHGQAQSLAAHERLEPGRYGMLPQPLPQFGALWNKRFLTAPHRPV